MNEYKQTISKEYRKDAQDFWNEQAEWSREAFGPDNERGPKGPLKHLALEVIVEMLGVPREKMEPILNYDKGRQMQLHDLEEYADILFLLCDSCRRAGFTWDELLTKAFQKLEKNKARKWQKPTRPDEPVEHVRGEEHD